jgi:hypothetical protein
MIPLNPMAMGSMDMTRIPALIVAFAISVVPVARADEAVSQEAVSTKAQARAAGLQIPEITKVELTTGLPREKAQSLPVYKLPPVGKPRRRIGGGRRGPLQDLPALYALAPEHVGQTLSVQPVLCWYLSMDAPAGSVIELTLIDEDAIDPLLDVSLPSAHTAGIHCAELSDYGAALERGREYEWSVALVVDPERRSLDVIATGWIERVDAPVALVYGLERARPDDAAALYAGAGLWYDAIGSVCPAASDGCSAGARLGLDALLEQVHLDRIEILVH